MIFDQNWAYIFRKTEKIAKPGLMKLLTKLRNFSQNWNFEISKTTIFKFFIPFFQKVARFSLISGKMGQLGLQNLFNS